MTTATLSRKTRITAKHRPTARHTFVRGPHREHADTVAFDARLVRSASKSAGEFYKEDREYDKDSWVSI